MRRWILSACTIIAVASFLLPALAAALKRVERDLKKVERELTNLASPGAIACPYCATASP